MDDVTRRRAIKFAATAGAITTGAVVLRAGEARADEDKPRDVGMREELDDDERKMVEGRAEFQLHQGPRAATALRLDGAGHFRPEWHRPLSAWSRTEQRRDRYGTHLWDLQAHEGPSQGTPLR